MQRLEIVRVKEADKKVQELEKKIRNKRALKRKRLEDMFTQSEDGYKCIGNYVWLNL
ncbi:hypothetical protein J6590_068964, partial [Homalodisca vitripennis]